MVVLSNLARSMKAGSGRSESERCLVVELSLDLIFDVTLLIRDSRGSYGAYTVLLRQAIRYRHLE